MHDMYKKNKATSIYNHMAEIPLLIVFINDVHNNI